MRAVVYHGPGQKGWEEVPEPVVGNDTFSRAGLHIGSAAAVTPGADVTVHHSLPPVVLVPSDTGS